MHATAKSWNALPYSIVSASSIELLHHYIKPFLSVSLSVTITSVDLLLRLWY